MTPNVALVSFALLLGLGIFGCMLAEANAYLRRAFKAGARWQIAQFALFAILVMLTVALNARLRSDLKLQANIPPTSNQQVKVVDVLTKMVEAPHPL